MQILKESSQPRGSLERKIRPLKPESVKPRSAVMNPDESSAEISWILDAYAKGPPMLFHTVKLGVAYEITIIREMAVWVWKVKASSNH